MHIGINTPRDFLNFKSNLYALINLVLWLPLTILTVCLFVELLVPKFLYRRKYFSFFIGALLVSLGIIVIAYFLAVLYMDHIFPHESGRPAGNFRTKGICILVFYWAFLFNISLSLAVSGIKLAKFLYLQQVENTELARNKKEYELRIKKSRIQPAFLLQSLDSIFIKVSEMQPNAPETILLFSELLSYILYDSDKTEVPLNKELDITQALISLEKLKSGNKPDFLLETNGSVKNKSIRPLQLFTCVQYLLQEISKQTNGQSVIKINMMIAENFINMPLPDILTNKNLNDNYAFENFHISNGVATVNMRG